MKKEFRNVAIVWFTTFIAWIINYGYHLVMINFLSLEDFAVFESILSLLNIWGVFFAAIALFFVKEISQHNSNMSWIKTLGNLLLKYSVLLWLILLLLVLVLIPVLNRFLQIDLIYIYVILGFCLLFTSMSLLHNSYFQWLKKFMHVSFFNVINPVSKLLWGYILVYYWYSVNGALWWVLLGIIVVLIVRHFIYLSEVKWISITWGMIKELQNDFSHQKTQILSFAISSLLLSFLMNGDIIIAKHLYSASDAWIFAWISVLTKAMLFLWMSIEMVYFPVLVEKKMIKKKPLFYALSLYVIVIIASLLGSYLLWDQILYVFKEGFEEYKNLLYLLFLFSGLLALLNLAVKLLVSYKKYTIIYTTIIFTLICYWYILFSQPDMYNLVFAMIVLMLLSLVFALYEIFTISID